MNVNLFIEEIPFQLKTGKIYDCAYFCTNNIKKMKFRTRNQQGSEFPPSDSIGYVKYGNVMDT